MIVPYESITGTDHRLQLRNSEDDTEVGLKNIRPHEHYRTLGAHINANGDYNKQLEVIDIQIKEWVASIQSSTLNRHKVRLVYQQYLLPQSG